MVLEMDMWREGMGAYWDAIEEQQAIREQEEAESAEEEAEQAGAS